MSLPGEAGALRRAERLPRDAPPIPCLSVGDSTLCLDRVVGPRVGIPPFGPSSWPPRSSAHPLRGSLSLGCGSGVAELAQTLAARTANRAHHSTNGCGLTASPPSDSALSRSRNEAPSPAPGPEVQKLAYFPGMWQAEGGPIGGPSAGKFSVAGPCEWFAGGFHVICRREGTSPEGNHADLQVFACDAKAKAYTFYGITGRGDAVRLVRENAPDRHSAVWTPSQERPITRCPYVLKGRNTPRWEDCVMDRPLQRQESSFRGNVSPSCRSWAMLCVSESQRVSRYATCKTSIPAEYAERTDWLCQPKGTT
jgi:hypothetical protein